MLQLDGLKELHANSAGLKATATWMAHQGIDECRRCCGGHGFSAYSGLPCLVNEFAVMCTWEGENTVMCLQLGRFLLSCLRK